MKTCPECGTLNDGDRCYRCHRDLKDIEETVFEFARDIQTKGVQEEIDSEVYKRMYPFSQKKEAPEIVKVDKNLEKRDYLPLIFSTIIIVLSFFRKDSFSIDFISISIGAILILSFFVKIIKKYSSIPILILIFAQYFLDKSILDNYINSIKSIDFFIWGYFDNFRLISISIFIYLISEYTFLKIESTYKGLIIVLSIVSFAFFLFYNNGFDITNSIFMRYSELGYQKYFISVAFIIFPIVLLFLRYKKLVQYSIFLLMSVYISLYPFENFNITIEKINIIYITLLISIFNYQKNSLFNSSKDRLDYF
ncbi:hypothetical protein JXR93_03720 [bacterium]|nr:hypothetical protein [bacterium]